MPVREVLRRLDALGLVEVVPHRGARVAELSVADLEDTYQTRRALESALVGLAASRFTEADADTAREALARHEQLIEAGEVDEARRAHTEFHFGIYRVSGSRWLVRSVEPVWQNSERYRFTSPDDPQARESSHAEHTEILTACVEKDEVRAKAAIGRHLDGALERIRRAMLA
ncbi:GntR family transcriptional regulator [Streptosporangium sp. NPDC051022]|uniref:GntR family transcriptional regulator n=1 Tax=Streptosporangium sp. NPDC051022 TaxID=3155752 RepID=UPI003437D87C